MHSFQTQITMLKYIHILEMRLWCEGKRTDLAFEDEICIPCHYLANPFTFLPLSSQTHVVEGRDLRGPGFTGNQIVLEGLGRTDVALRARCKSEKGCRRVCEGSQAAWRKGVVPAADTAAEE